MQSWADFAVGDIVEVVDWSPLWNGTTGEIVAIEKAEDQKHIACQLRYLSFPDGTLDHWNARVGEVEQGFGWYLNDGHIRLVTRKCDDDEIGERWAYWQKFFEGDK